MIFLTVGTQLPFERLVMAMDQWAKGREIEVFAQVGTTSYKPKHMTVVEDLSPSKYSSILQGSSIVVSHVGMGTIISGLMNGIPMVLMPRLAKLGEHRNDHQLATASKFSQHALISIVESDDELFESLDVLISNPMARSAENLQVAPELLGKLNDFLSSVKSDVSS